MYGVPLEKAIDLPEQIQKFINYRKRISTMDFSMLKEEKGET